MNQVRLSSEILKYTLEQMEQEGASTTLQPIAITPITLDSGDRALPSLLAADLKVLLNASEDGLALREEIEAFEQERKEINNLVVEIGAELREIKDNLRRMVERKASSEKNKSIDRAIKSIEGLLMHRSIECIEGLLTEIYDGSRKV